MPSCTQSASWACLSVNRLWDTRRHCMGWLYYSLSNLPFPTSCPLSISPSRVFIQRLLSPPVEVGPRRTWQMLGLWAEGLPGQSWGTEVITMSEVWAVTIIKHARMPTCKRGTVLGSCRIKTQTSGQGICRRAPSHPQVLDLLIFWVSPWEWRLWQGLGPQ